MTRAELNASIDAIFDNNRADNSLTPAMEGTEFKKVADYVDQEVAKPKVTTHEFSPGAGTVASPVVMTKDYLQVIPADETNSFVKIIDLSAITPSLFGKQIIIDNSSPTVSVTLVSANGADCFYKDNTGVLFSSMLLLPNTRYRLTFLGGYIWFAETASIQAKTQGLVTADASPYPELIYSLNSVNTNAIGDKVVLPATAEIGEEVLVFALNNANSFSVMANQAGTARISSGGIASASGNLSIGPNISVRFIHLNNGYWKAEII